MTYSMMKKITSINFLQSYQKPFALEYLFLLLLHTVFISSQHVHTKDFSHTIFPTRPWYFHYSSSNQSVISYYFRNSIASHPFCYRFDFTNFSYLLAFTWYDVIILFLLRIGVRYTHQFLYSQIRFLSQVFVTPNCVVHVSQLCHQLL